MRCSLAFGCQAVDLAGTGNVEADAVHEEVRQQGHPDSWEVQRLVASRSSSASPYSTPHPSGTRCVAS